MKVYVAIYEHRYGQDVRVFDNIDKVEAWKSEIANEYFEHEFKGLVEKPDNLQEVTEIYWDGVEDEWFTVEICEVE
jgi:hypothetical protein